MACLDVTIKAVVGGIQGAVSEPLRERRITPVEDLGRLGVPAQPFRLCGPEILEVASASA